VDFPRVLGEVARFLDAQGARWGIAGAVALQAYGLTRATTDLDFVVDQTIKAELARFLESLGYETLRITEGFSNHVHREEVWGRVDFIYLDATTSQKLFARAEKRTIFPGFDAAVPRPEHLAAMKVQAMKNDPGRLFKEMADVQLLLQLPGVDVQEISGYFEKQGLKDYFDAIQDAIARSRNTIH